MSGTFWKFGNNYSEKSAINELLENGFLEQTESPERQRNESVSSQSSEDSEDSSQYNQDETIEEENNYTPNLEILDQLLDEQDILEELAGSNLKLIEYLRHHDVLDQLVTYIITEDVPEAHGLEAAITKSDDDDKSSTASSADSDDEFEQEETPEKIHARRAQVAAEILSLDVWSLTDSFMDNHDLLKKLWSILDNICPLSMTSSTYFMKINEHLLDVKTHGMLRFLLGQADIVDRFLKHIDNPPLMDFLLKVISTDKPDNPSGIIELLKDQGLISKLIDFLDPSVNASVQSAAGDFIKAFVTISANSNTDNSTIGPNELTRELVSEKIMERLCELMLHGGTSLANGVGIMIEIIRKNNSDYDFVPVLYITIESHPPTSRDPIYLGHLIKVFSKNIPKFTKMLDSTKLKMVETPFGKIEPLGFERFKICELIAELLHCSNMGLLNDEAGEDIVRERDIERERILALEKEQRPEDDDFDHDVSREIKGLSIASTGSLEKDTEDPDVTVDDDQSSENEDDEKEETSAARKGEKGKESSKPNVESEPDSDADTTIDVRYDDNEVQLRQDPVVGDQLKISLADNGVILVILKMFFRFPWNNFLHNVVFDIVQQILNGSMDIGYNKYLAIDLFCRGEITKLIIEGQEKCEAYEEEHGLRLGYMGHLTLIAEEVVKFTALYLPSSIHQVVLDAVSAPEWTKYVTETLVETREKYNALLGGEAEDEDKDDEKKGLVLDSNVDHDISGSGFEDEQPHDEEEEEGDQFSRYMSQQMTNDLPDKFGSSDEDDEEEDVHQGFHTAKEYFPVDDDDDYVDPNDDGQSYTKKSHPLYDEMLSTTSEKPPPSFDDYESSSDEDEEEGTGLTRSTSHGELEWDEDEQNRLINMASYIKSHQ
jgi:SIT4-associating protein SAP185/190